MPSSVDINLLQRHTVEIYGLDKKDGILETVDARNLLSPQRFDLFAKLYYLNHRESEPELARKVYLEHIKAFNPDGKEPGRNDKACWDDFLSSFDLLIDNLHLQGFDQTRSLVPVGKDSVILDGAHRIAILAYFNRPVQICRFEKVAPKGPFDFTYFLNRGLSQETADKIALEATSWFSELRIACLWPRIGNTRKKDTAERMLGNCFPIIYNREFAVTRKALTLLVTQIYQNQDWLGGQDNGYSGALDKANHCFALNRKIRFIFFVGGPANNVSCIKEAIRETTPYGKHSIHITDTTEEALNLAMTILSEKGRKEWLNVDKTSSLYGMIHDKIHDSFVYFQNVVWLDFKARLARMLPRIRK